MDLVTWLQGGGLNIANPANVIGMATLVVAAGFVIVGFFALRAANRKH